MSDDEELRDEAQPDDTAIETIEASPDAETEFHPFSEVDEEFKPGPAVFVRDENGVPIRLDQTTESDIPALSTKSLVCMGDYSKFVVRDRWGEIIVSFEASEVQRAPDGCWRVKTNDLLERARLRIEQRRATYKELLGAHRGDVQHVLSDATDAQIFLQMLLRPGETGALDPDWVEVEPIRPPCTHYVRQLASFHLNAAHNTQYRLCSARRTTEGTFMTVRDTGVFACDMRHPFDAESSKLLDDFDTRKVAQGQNREHISIFESATPQANSLEEH